MHLSQVSIATATATAMLASMAQSAKAQSPEASPAPYNASQDPEWITGISLPYLVIAVPLLICCCCIGYSKIDNSYGLGRNDRRNRILTGDVLEQQGIPTAPDPVLQGVCLPAAQAPVVVVDLGLVSSS
jgi:hypothetical protein